MGTSPSADLIAKYCDHQRMRGRSKRTIDGRRWLLTKADRELPHGLDKVADDELVAWLYRDDLTSNAKAAYYDALNTFYAYHVARGEFPYNPMADLPRPQEKRGRPRPVKHEQLARILAEAAQPYRLWALLAAGLGARCVEISRLDVEDVGPEVTWLHGKGDKERIVPTHREVYAAVAVLPPGPVARTQAGTRATAHYVTNMASAYFGHDMGMPGVALHRLRHWHATYVDTTDIQVAQTLLGHEDPKTTTIYRAVAPEALRAAVDGLPLPVSPAVGVSAAAGPPPGVGRRSPLPTGVSGPQADPWGRGRR